MSEADIKVFIMARPGPPGTGVTEADWDQIREDVDVLMAGSYNGQFHQDGVALQDPYTTNRLLGDTVPGMTVTIPSLDITMFHRVVAQGKATVTTTDDNIVEINIRLSNGGPVVDIAPADFDGPSKMTPTAEGTYIVKFYGAWDVWPGATSISIDPWFTTTEAIDVTFDALEMDLTVIPQEV